MNDAKSGKHPGWEPTIVSMCASALLGGMLGLAIIALAYPMFAYPDLPEVPIEPSARHAELIQQHIEARGEFYSHNYAAAFGILGACLGACIGGFTVRSRRLPSAFAGALLGGFGGGIAGFVGGTPIGEAVENSSGFSLEEASLFQVSMWAAMIVGLTIGIGLVQGGVFQAAKAAVCGLIAAAIAAAVYLMGASIIFLSDNMVYILPESSLHRAFWVATCALITAAILARGLQPGKAKAAVEEVDAETDSEA